MQIINRMIVCTPGARGSSAPIGIIISIIIGIIIFNGGHAKTRGGKSGRGQIAGRARRTSGTVCHILRFRRIQDLDHSVDWLTAGIF